MTGPLILASDPTTSLGAATKQYVDAHAGGGTGTGTSISDTLTRLQIPSATIPSSISNFTTTDGALWVQSSDTTQPTYTTDTSGRGWIIDQTSGYAKMAWFKNTGAMAISDWNVTASTGTDNSVALLEMNAFGRKVCAAGKRFVLDATPNNPNGCWGFNYNNCANALLNLTRFTLEGGGSKWINTQGQGASSSTYNPWFYVSMPNANMGAQASGYLNSYFPLSANANIGDTTVTLATAGNTASFAVGDWIAVVSFCIQYSGYPHNWDRVEFVQITSIGTGTLTFTPALRYPHRTDFPDDVTAGQFPGAAKVIQLNSPVGALYHPTGFTDPVTWDCDHIYRNMTVLPAINSTLTYNQICCRKYRIENCTWVGNSESMCMDFSSLSTIFNAVPEPDKNVGRVHHEKSSWPQSINFQSASFNSVVFDDCVVTGTNGLGAAGHNVAIRGGYFSNLAVGANASGTSNIIITGAEITNYKGPAFAGKNLGTIDGTNLQYANGVFKCTKTYAGLNNIMSVTPGSQLYWQPNTSTVGLTQMYPGDFGLMTVQQVYQDATYVYYVTNSSFAAQPTWTDGTVYIVGTQSLLINNSTGCDVIRNYSEACRRGFRATELSKTTYFGTFATSATLQYPNRGIIKTIRVTVRQTTAIAGAYWQVEIPMYQATAPTTPFDASHPNFRVYIDTSHFGQRIINTTGPTGFLGSDAITWGGIDSVTAIPANALIGPQIAFWVPINGPPTNPLNTLPIVDLEIESDLGMLGPLTTMYGLSATTIAGVVGMRSIGLSPT